MRAGILRAVAAGAMVVAVAGCTGLSGEDEPKKSGHSGAWDAGNGGGDGGAARLAAVGKAVGVNRVVNNANGSQLQVDQLVFHKDRIELDGGFTNGGKETNEITFGKGTYLQDDKGRRYDVQSPTGKIEVAPKTDRTLGLSFEPAISKDAQRLTLHVNDTPFAGTSEISELTEMVIKDIPTSGPSSRSVAAAPVAAKGSKVVANGTEAQIDGLSFTPNRIGARFTLRNGGDSTSNIAGYWKDTYALDNLGNRYPVLLPKDAEDNKVSVEPGKALDGVLVFAGRLDPDATRLTININAIFGGTSEIATNPEFHFGPYEVGTAAGTDASASSATPLPKKLLVHKSQNLANGTQLRLKSFSFGPDTITAKITFDNGSEYGQVLNYGGDDTKLFDEDGNEYPILPPRGNKELRVPVGKRIDAKLVFSGRVHEDATRIRLAVNEIFGGTSEISSTPEFHFGPYKFTRPTGGSDARADAEGFAVGVRTDLPDRKLGSSSAHEVARTASKYNGKETGDGVRLTVPTRVLFDFDSAKLRPDGRRAVGELADVLDYYGDAPTRVVGYTDSVGSKGYNKRLSAKRAHTVTDALVEDYGIDRSRLTPAGRGEANPIARNTSADGSDNPQGRQKNRRVVLEIKTDKGLPN